MRLALVALLCLVGPQVSGAELSPLVGDGAVGVRIDGLEFPTSLPGELRSGLTNRLYLRLTLLDGTTPLQQHTAEMAIRYDLWEETFVVTRTVDNTTAEPQLLRSPSDIAGLLSAISIPRVFAAAGLPTERALMIRAELLLNPIRREKLRLIRKWVAENSAPDMGRDRGPSASSAIFNRIFEQYADGADIAALWRADLTSRPFMPAP